MDTGHFMTSNYMEHGFCLNWEPTLVALHVGSDIITGISYYSIPLAMFYFVYRRPDLPFYKLFVMFALFILSCGTTHLFSAYTIYRPEYWTEGYVKAFTAAISALTAFIFIPRIPEAIALPSIVNSMEEIKQLNIELAHKNTELQMANFSIEHVLDSVYWISADAKILRVNESACKALGYTIEEMLEFKITDLDPHFPLERWAEHWDQLKAEKSLMLETQQRKKNGSLLDVEVSASYISFEGQEFNCAIVRDITSRKRGESDRIELEKQLLHAQKLESLGVLAGGIAHDFNNILMAILGNADLALMKLTPESPVTENLFAIEKAAARAADLAKQMLAYSGKGKFVVEPIDLNRLLEEMLHMLKVSISKKAVLRFNPALNLPTVEADATQIRQVVMNLVINASEAIGDRSGVIAINTGCMECDRSYLKNVWMDDNIAEGTYLYLEISDTGCGMDSETVSKIFDPFFTTKFTGRGLGMAAVMGIIRGHKGSIKVYSEPGKGTTFKLLLPASGRPLRQPSSDEGCDVWCNSGKVLLVDDEETVQATTGKMLRELGFEVLTADDGREAVEMFKSNKGISFVLLDLTMPHVDGEQCFRELRTLDPAVRVIMSSGYNEQEVTQRFVGKGLAGFIQKPYKMSELKQAIIGTGYKAKLSP
jgi:PAS domain S-box-containing protein